MKVHEIINKVNKASQGKILISVYNRTTKQNEDFVISLFGTKVDKNEFPFGAKVESISFWGEHTNKAYLHIYASVS